MAKSKKIVAIAFSDLHANNWKNPEGYKGNRLDTPIKALEIVLDKAAELKVPILFGGDLIHNPKSVTNEVLDKVISTISFHKKTVWVGIDGNHDQSQRNTLDNRSPNWLNTLTNCFDDFINLNGEFSYTNGWIDVYGIPYLSHNSGFKELLKGHIKRIKDNILFRGIKILLIHTDLPGATNAFGFEIGESDNIPKDLDKFFKHFDLVLCGHIHKPQILTPKVVMMGSPYHQNSGDIGIDMGYWEIYDDASYKFVKLNLPEYKYYEGEKPNDEHIYIPLPKKQVKTEIILNHQFNNKNSKTSIAKSYLKAKKVKKKRYKKALIKALA